MGKKHDPRKIKELHEGKNPGCIWRHESGYGSYRSKDCHYRKNGFAASDGRRDMYDKDHRAIADRLGYGKLDVQANTFTVVGGAGSQLEKDLQAGKRSRKSKPLAGFLKKFRGKFNRSIKWLEYDAKGWSLDHRETAHPVRGAPSVEPTFKPKDKDTYAHGAWYPYHHEYHHLISIDALRKYVVTEKDVDRRTERLLATGWNVNTGKNVAFLPTEVSVAAIVELPAHCPWDLPDHPQYSSSLADFLQQARSMLDDAARGGEDCEEALSDTSFELDSAADRALKAVKKVKGPLGALPPPTPKKS